VDARGIKFNVDKAMEATMCPTAPASEHFGQAEKLRQLRLQLVETTDEPKRHIILRQIEELEEESKLQSKLQ
jgi:hypothetical protein